MTLRWPEIALDRREVRLVPREVVVPVRADGGWIACGVPLDADVVASAEGAGRRTGTVELRATADGVHRRDFLLGAPVDSAAGAAGPATLTGVVRRANGRPVENARVVVIDAAGGGETRDDGTFRMTGLPAGTYTVEARAIGYVPSRAVVTLSGRAPAAVELTLDQRVATLENVVVTGRRSYRNRRMEEILQRKRINGFGRLVTAADIEKQRSPLLSQTLRTVPGLWVLPAARGNGYEIRGRLQCKPAVFIDGMGVFNAADDLDMLVPPHTVLAVEIYTGVASVPANFPAMGGNSCGTVLVWTK